MRDVRERRVLLDGILFLFFLQLLTLLIESIYVMDLLNTSLDEKALGTLFLLSPLLLPLLGKGRRVERLLVAVMLLARLAAPIVPSGPRILVAGIGVAAFLLLLPRLLDGPRQAHEPGRSLALALLLSTALRALGSSRDLSLFGPWQVAGLALALLAVTLLLTDSRQSRQSRQKSEEIEGIERRGRGERVPSGDLASVFGVVGILTLVYFVLQAPGNLSRWSGAGYVAVTIVAAMAYMSYLIQPLRSRAVVATGLPLFVAALVAAAVAGRVDVITDPASSWLVAGPVRGISQLPLFLMLLTSPALFIALDLLAKRMAGQPTTEGRRALVWGGAMLWLTLLVFMLIFTNVWGFISPISLPFRNQFWLPFLLAGLTVMLPVLASLRSNGPVRGVGFSSRSPLTTMTALTTALLTVVGLAVTQARPVEPGAVDELTIMTYNAQQAVDEQGALALDEQLAFIRSVDPDILMLQESDSARISRGHDDLVRYYANGLDMYHYYGPDLVTGTFGTAILSRWPLTNPRALFSYSHKDEVATAAAEITIHGRQMVLFSVHPAGNDDVDRAFVDALLAEASAYDTVIAAGDYNMKEYEAQYQRVAGVYQDVWRAQHPLEWESLDELKARAETMGKGYVDGVPNLAKRIDHIFVSDNFEVIAATYAPPEISRTDHPAHWTRVRLR